MARLLKRLELNGFKSFAQKTVFDFSGGITAIVGPNGSGKSNIIDAIRWLLGEREAKNLRGSKSEDLIFAGTAQRARLGQASASLYFENQNGHFPVDFEEIDVSREARRDGTNRYFINKSEVRLKDLVDFFAQARLGSRGLVVVTQGESDMFLKATPVIRREMIEEMLGLREYQLKKTEAERRLKNTQINLDKVHALTEEILPHLRSLKRQTGRWERRESLEQELKDLENRLFGSLSRELREGLKAAEVSIAEHGKGKIKLEEEKKSAGANLAKVESSQPVERKEMQDLKKRAAEYVVKRGEIQKEIGRLEAQIELGGETQAAPRGRDGEAQALLKQIKIKLELALDNPENLDRVINEILEKIEEFTAGSSPAEGQPKSGGSPELQAKLQKIKQEFAGMEKELLALNQREKELEKGQEEFYQLFKSAVAAVEAAKDKLERWENEGQRIKFEKERLEMRREEWERQVRQAGRQPEEFLRSEEKLNESDRPEMERRVFKLRGDLASIGEIDEALLKEAKETETRYEFLKKEAEDLVRAKDDLKKMIEELNGKIHTEFGSALGKINEEFNKFFGLMFGGGSARLKLTIKEKPVKAEELQEKGEEIEDAVLIEDKPEEEERGIEVDLKLPRKRINSLDVLSGGERSLVGIAALFALISVSPPPFLVLDEVDAPLDERNARRFAEMLKEFSRHTQFIIVTHNRVTMEVADMLYGVTMNEDGSSKILSLKFEAVSAPAA